MSSDGGLKILDRHRPLVQALQAFAEKLVDSKPPPEAQLRQELKSIAAISPNVLDHILDLFPHLPAELHRVSIYCLACLGQEPIVPGLLELVRDDRVPDESRWELVQAMVDLGFDLTSEDLSQHFDEFGEGGDAEQDIEDMLESISDDRYALSHWLAQLQSMRLEIRCSLIEDLSKSGERALPVLNYLLDVQDPEIHDAIIKALRGVGTSRAISLLRRARAEAPDLRHSQRAYDAERTLLDQGVKALESGDPRPPALETLFGQCVATFVDASGSRSLMLSRQHQVDSERLDCLYLLSHVEKGVKDCVGQQDIGIEDYQETLPTLVGSLGGGEMPVRYVLSLIGDALYRNHHEKLPISYPFAAWREILLGGGVEPQAVAYQPDLSALQPNPELLTDSAALEATGELFDEPPFTGWLVDRAEIFQVLVETGHYPVTSTRALSLSTASSGLKDLLVRRVIEPRIPVLARSLELNADLFARLSRTEQARTCLLVRSVLLAGNREQIESLGFVQRLLDQSVEHVLEESHEDMVPVLPLP